MRNSEFSSGTTATLSLHVTRTAPARVSASASYWLTIALITQGFSALMGIMQGGIAGPSLVSWATVSIVFLVLALRGHEWARLAFLTLTIWGLGTLAMMAVAVQFVPSATIDLNWIDVGLSAIAIAATLTAKRLPRLPLALR